MGELVYLAGAYAVIWLLLFGYVLSLAYREQELRRDVTLITQVLREREVVPVTPDETEARVPSKQLEVSEASAAR